MALISEQHKAIYLANPGTGSTAVQTFLVNQLGWELMSDKHAGFNQVEERLQLNMNDYFIVTTVRNPFQFFASEYSRFRGNWAEQMRNDPNHWIHSDDSVKRRIEIALSGNFAQFVDYYLKNTHAPRGRWRVQYWGKAQFVMKTENLRMDFNNFMRALRIPVPDTFPIINQTPAKFRIEKNELFTEELITRVHKAYQPFIELFDYNF